MNKYGKLPVIRYCLQSGLILALGAVAACNTTEGMGKDMKSAGEAMSETAREAKE